MFILAAGQIKIIFVQNTEALRRLHSHQFSIGQTPERAEDLCGVPGSSGRFVRGHGMLRPCSGSLLPHLFCKMFDLN